MSIKAYKNRVVPCPCKREWTWMLDEQHIGCSEALNNNPDFEGCENVACCDCIYSSNPQRAEYYKHCFSEVRPKLTAEVFNRPDCPEWAEWAAVDKDGRAFWYQTKPSPSICSWHAADWRPEESIRYCCISRNMFDATDWKSSLISRSFERFCNTCKNYEPKNQADREMIPVYEFDWYTQWKYSPSKDTYYLEDINKNRARELKTGELVNEIPADVVVVRPQDPSPATLIRLPVQNVRTGDYHVVQRVKEDCSVLWIADTSYSKYEFYKTFVDIWGRPVCHFERVTK